MTTIHTRIKQRREALGMTMKALAEMVGVAAWQTIQQWEREDGTAPKRDRLAAVAKALQTTPETLLFGEKEQAHANENVPGERRQSSDALKVGAAFDRLTQQEKDTIISILKTYGAI